MNSDDPAIRVAAAIQDFGELVNALSAGVSGPLPWQRQLVAHLDGMAGVIQILRMSVVLARPDAEVREAAQVLLEHTRQASLAVAGSRADATVRVALRLALSLALTISTGLRAAAPPGIEEAPLRRRA
ncbi:MAG: hypothetical protein JNL93_13790 [Pelomonas sp.]|nr:hypothetical protein [Roseateles sp.]